MTRSLTQFFVLVAFCAVSLGTIGTAWAVPCTSLDDCDAAAGEFCKPTVPECSVGDDGCEAECANISAFVPDAAGYEVMYSVDIITNPRYRDGVPYRNDRRADWDYNFVRVGYYFELTRPDAEPEFIFVSGYPLSFIGTELGIPHLANRFVYQEALNDINVTTNVDGIQEGRGLAGGWVEMWSDNYGQNNRMQVPNASSATYDFGDDRSGGGSYGSFQVHDFENETVLFAFNRFNDGARADVGIGNRANSHPDYTFASNANQYRFRRLVVFALPGQPPPPATVRAQSPTYCSIAQRRDDDVGTIDVRLISDVPAERVAYRIVPPEPAPEAPGAEPDEAQMDDAGVEANQALDAGAPGPEDPPAGEEVDAEPVWIPLGDFDEDLRYEGRLELPSGWHTVEFRTFMGDLAVGQVSVSGVGVGELFITAGQSNSANFGLPALEPTDQRVCQYDGETWQFAVDPQPLANGVGGSPWPVLGDLMAAQYDVPIGFISVGQGGSAVQDWQPGNQRNFFGLLQRALNAVPDSRVRAILWHQGENNAIRRTSSEVYRDQLQSLIDASRRQAGWEVPWGVARASYLPRAPQAFIDAVVEGQNMVIADTPSVFAGPNTNDLIGDEWRHDQVHFNEAGLREHAARWFDAIPLPQCQGLVGVVDIEPCDAPEAPNGGMEADAGFEMDAGVDLDAGLSDAAVDDDGAAPRPDVGAGELNEEVDAVVEPDMGTDAGVQPDMVVQDGAMEDAAIEDAAHSDAQTGSDATMSQDSATSDGMIAQDSGAPLDMAPPSDAQLESDAAMEADASSETETDLATQTDVDATQVGDMAPPADSGSAPTTSDDGCGCDINREPPTASLWLLVFLLVLTRRRRHV